MCTAAGAGYPKGGAAGNGGTTSRAPWASGMLPGWITFPK